jgi:hypothetical protein
MNAANGKSAAASPAAPAAMVFKKPLRFTDENS